MLPSVRAGVDQPGGGGGQVEVLDAVGRLVPAKEEGNGNPC